jgi:alpha-beta hydrolase superfamily lysophospholipase
VPHLVALQSHQISAADGTALQVSDYLLPSAEVRGGIVLMHGLGEHSGRYRHMAQFFNGCGLSVRCYDQRGHGRSQGDRGDVINGDPMIQDAQIIVDDFAERFSSAPLLFGHSMGALFAARLALSRRSPLRGLILSSPALGLRLSPIQARLLNAMQLIAPWLAVPNGLAPAFLSHDAKVVHAYKSDPLVHGKISARLLRSMLSSIDYCHAHARSLAVPTLMLVAGEDHLVDVQASKRFYEHTPAGLAQLHIYENFYHEVFNEVESHKPLADMRAWLERQLS